MIKKLFIIHILYLFLNKYHNFKINYDQIVIRLQLQVLLKKKLAQA